MRFQSSSPRPPVAGQRTTLTALRTVPSLQSEYFPLLDQLFRTMIYHVARMTQWCRILCQRLLLQFGLHCATHQIRIILVSCVVITSLFYPALAIYSSSQHKALSIFNTFRTPFTVSALDAQKDLQDLWSYHPGLRIHDDPLFLAKCSRALRVERLLIPGPNEYDGALSRQTLLSTLDLELRLESLVSGGNSPCLKRPDGKCFVLSPLLFWNHDREALLTDNNTLDALTSSKNILLGGISIKPEMVLANRALRESHGAELDFDFADYLAVTYFFPGSDCLGVAEHESWLQSVNKAYAQDVEVDIKPPEPTILALEYDLDLQKAHGWSALMVSLYMAYIGFFSYVAWSVGKMTAVHSRLGVTFTALVEIAVSTVTSLSVCALVGFKVTMVPWEILPIVIIFVGAENMFNLVDAVTKTSVTLPVKQRIAEGLSRAGTSNTFKVLTYNAILGTIAVFWAGAIRQFCSFAIVVLVAHWFLAHTFFLAVLSIDLQRLELDELLRHGTSTLAPSNTALSKEHDVKKPRSAVQKLFFSVQNLLKSRAATNLSLVMLLAITATLYYATYTSASKGHQIGTSELRGSQSLGRIAKSASVKEPTAWHIWKALNPGQLPLFHLRVELPSIVTFRFDSDQEDALRHVRKHNTRFSMRTFRLALWLLKIMILPIAATTSALWGLLLYLLKNAELLEAQRNRAEPDLPDANEDPEHLEGQVQFSTLPRTFASDVELISVNKDGNVIVSVGLYNELSIWRVDKQFQFTIDATDVLHQAASTSSAVSTLTSLAVDNNGSYCAVGTGAGVIAVWHIEAEKPQLMPLLTLDNSSAAVTGIQFLPADGQLTLLATYESGAAVNWSFEKGSAIQHFTPSSRASICSSSLVRVHPLDHCLIAFSLDDGTLEIVESRDREPVIMHDFCVQAGDPINTATKVSVCQTELRGSTQLIVAVATESGPVTVWDGLTGECISVFDETYGRINHIHATPVHCEICRHCGQLPLEGVCIALSIDHIVHFFRLYLNNDTRRCACFRHNIGNIPLRDGFRRRSRSNSTTSQHGTASPSIPRARLATNFEVPAFPVSGHGIHSRRASEKDTTRRSLDSLSVPCPSDGYESDSRVAPNVSSFWRDAVLVREKEVTCERGGWGVSGKNIIGVRRKPRPQATMKGRTMAVSKFGCSQELTTATLERWELWVFDPSASRLRSSLLSVLIASLNRDRISSSPFFSSEKLSNHCVHRLPFTRVSPFHVTSTHAFGGFGNTIGRFQFFPS